MSRTFRYSGSFATNSSFSTTIHCPPYTSAKFLFLAIQSISVCLREGTINDCFDSRASCGGGTAYTIRRSPGSYSLKDVLPALVFGMTYVGMSEGQDAGIAWESLVRGGLDQAEREKTERRFWIIAGLSLIHI